MKKAFTLIELLVVILIIGILAAVALPQYQKAVEKSRMTEAKLALKNLYQGYQLCELSYGKEADECCLSLFEVIATPLPGEIRTNECIDDSCVNTKDWQYGTEGCGRVYANRMPADAAPYYLALDLSSGEISCSEKAPSFCNEP